MCVVKEWQNKKNDSNNNKLTKRKKVMKAQRKPCFTESRIQLRFTEKLKKRPRVSPGE